jgi:bacterial/archaeal transporter family protein
LGHGIPVAYLPVTGGSEMIFAHDWFVWAFLSAVFAALTAIFAKLGLTGINSDFATLVHTVVIGL